LALTLAAGNTWGTETRDMALKLIQEEVILTWDM
jgi:hypothetical protein